MLRTSRPARGRNRAGIGSAFALAIALASATAATPALAQAPAAQAQANYKPSRGFGKVYEPIATIANAEAGDFAAARGKLPALIAAIENEDDRYLAGNVHFTLGLKLRDRALQQQGMELMLASGKATPQAAAEMNYYLGEWAYDAQQWARARQCLPTARAGGYTQGNAIGLTAES